MADRPTNTTPHPQRTALGAQNLSIDKNAATILSYEELVLSHKNTEMQRNKAENFVKVVKDYVANTGIPSLHIVDTAFPAPGPRTKTAVVLIPDSISHSLITNLQDLAVACERTALNQTLFASNSNIEHAVFVYLPSTSVNILFRKEECTADQTKNFAVRAFCTRSGQEIVPCCESKNSPEAATMTRCVLAAARVLFCTLTEEMDFSKPVPGNKLQFFLSSEIQKVMFTCVCKSCEPSSSSTLQKGMTNTLVAFPVKREHLQGPTGRSEIQPLAAKL